MENRINYHGKVFIAVENSDHGDVSSDTYFYYFQEGACVWGTYFGQKIVRGSLIARYLEGGYLEMRYQHLDHEGSLKTGRCNSRPEILSNGRIRLYESWQWTCDDFMSGSSVIEEVLDYPALTK